MNIDKASETASKYYEVRQKLEKKQEELSKVRSEVFATDSEEVEQKARTVFDNFGVDNGDEQIQRIDELDEKISDLDDRTEKLEAELFQHLEDLRLPFDQSVTTRDSEVAFNFSEPLSEPLIHAISDTHPTALESIELRKEELAVESGEVNEAVSIVEEFLTEVREAANKNKETDKSNLYNVWG